MATVITRDGVVLHQAQLTQEQKDQGWAMVFAAFLRLHPEMLNTGGQEAAAPAQAQP